MDICDRVMELNWVKGMFGNGSELHNRAIRRQRQTLNARMNVNVSVAFPHPPQYSLSTFGSALIFLQPSSRISAIHPPGMMAAGVGVSLTLQLRMCAC